MSEHQLSTTYLKKSIFELTVIQVISDYVRVFYYPSDIQKAYSILLVAIGIALVCVIRNAVAFYLVNKSVRFRNLRLSFFIIIFVIWSNGMLFIWANLYGT